MQSRSWELNCISRMNSASRRKRRRQWLLHCSRMRRGIGGQAMCRRPRERSGRRSWGRFRMHKAAVREHANSMSFASLRMTSLFHNDNSFQVTILFRMTVLLALVGAWLLPLLSCSQPPNPNALVMIIESSPTNLDPRVGIDAQSERIDQLIFDDLLELDEHLNVTPALADRWEIPDPLTYVFHIHHDVKFHDGRPLTSRDVKWTFDSLLQGKIRSTKAAVYR